MFVFFNLTFFPMFIIDCWSTASCLHVRADLQTLNDFSSIRRSASARRS